MLVKCKPCTHCNKIEVVEMTDAQFKELTTSGRHIQDIFPNWSAPQRELLITGIHPECWTAIFSGPEE